MDKIMRQYFKAYLELGGSVTNYKKFESLHDEFINHTLKSFVDGEMCEEGELPYKDEKGFWYYHSNQQSMDGFCQATNLSYEEASKIFDAIDSVTSYS